MKKRKKRKKRKEDRNALQIFVSLNIDNVRFF